MSAVDVVDLYACGDDERKLGSASTRSSQISKYNFRSRSSMQNLLTQYGLTREYERSKPHISSKKINKKQRAFSDVESRKEEAKMKTRKQYYTQIYEDMYKLRDYFRDEYMDRLEVKVKKQKAKAAELEDIAKQREIQQKIKEKQQKNQKKLEKHDLMHDAGYLKNVPKSQHYKFAALERKLKAQGKLNTKEEIEEFWANINSDEMFKKYVKLAQSGKETASFSVVPHTDQQPAVSTRLTQITESRESSGCSVKNLVNRFLQPSNTWHKNQDAFSIARQAAAELDQKHPQLHLPNLHCFETEVPGETSEDESETDWQTYEHTKQGSYLKKLRHMYDLANCNNASTRRIFANHDNEFQRNNDGPFICEMIPSELLWPPNDEPPSLPESRSETAQPWLRYIKKKPIHQDEPVNELAMDSAISKPSTPSTPSTLVKSLPASRNSKCVIESISASQPLGLNELMQKSKTLEAKCSSTFWTNYMNAGKSAFATG